MEDLFWRVVATAGVVAVLSVVIQFAANGRGEEAPYGELIAGATLALFLGSIITALVAGLLRIWLVI